MKIDAIRAEYKEKNRKEAEKRTPRKVGISRQEATKYKKKKQQQTAKAFCCVNKDKEFMSDTMFCTSNRRYK